MQPKFKSGDFVYCPKLGNDIFELQGNFEDEINDYNKEFPLIIFTDQFFQLFTEQGRTNPDIPMPQIFHANEENHSLLERLFGMEFEKPKLEMTPRRIIEHLLKTHKLVPCLTSDFEQPTNSRSNAVKRFIIAVEDYTSQPFLDTSGGAWQFAVPFDTKTGEIITEIN